MKAKGQEAGRCGCKPRPLSQRLLPSRSGPRPTGSGSYGGHAQPEVEAIVVTPNRKWKMEGKQRLTQCLRSAPLDPAKVEETGRGRAVGRCPAAGCAAELRLGKLAPQAVLPLRSQGNCWQ